MSNIEGLGQTGPIQRLQPTKPAAKTAEAGPAAAADRRDRVELSGVRATMLSKLKASGDVRLDKVNDIRAQIEAGTYETPEKMDAAIDKLLDDLA